MSSNVLPRGLEQFGVNDDQLAKARSETHGLLTASLYVYGDPVMVDLPRGEQSYYFFYRNGDTPPEKTFIHTQPMSNDMNAQASAQVHAIQRLTGQNVLVIPQNNYHLTAKERLKVASGNFDPIGDKRLFLLQHAHYAGHLVLDSLRAGGFSLGATDNSATMKAVAEKEVGEIEALAYGEAVNQKRRFPTTVTWDFTSPSTDKLSDAVLMSKFPALVELFGVSEEDKKSPYLSKDLSVFAKNFIMHHGLSILFGLSGSSFSEDVIASLPAMKKGSNLVIHNDRDSLLTRKLATDEVKSEVTQAATPYGVDVTAIETSTERKIGHAIGDNPWLWATIVRISLKQI